MRGGILDVYGPEMERPVRIDFFGDEIESMRRFDPETQRSSSAVDEVLLLPLTETPATEATLRAINARLTRKSGAELADIETAATIFPGWEFYAAVAGAKSSLLELMGTQTRVFVEEPAMV